MKFKKKLLYKIHLLEALSQDIDKKIDNPPLDYIFFKNLLKKRQNYDIINEKT